MLTNIKYILITAIRDRLFAGLFVGVIFATFVSSVMGGTAMLEPEQMTLTFTAAAARMILVVGLIVFTCFHVRNAFDTKEIDVLLSRPISRTNLVLSYWMGFATVALLLVMPTLAVIYWVGLLSQNGFIAWSVSFLVETWLVVAVSLFAAFTLKSAVSAVLASLGFYVLSRMMGFFVATSDGGVLFDQQEINIAFTWIMDIISIVIPRLDFFAKSNWLIYGVPSMDDVQLFLIQGTIFIPLLLVAAMIDFKRKQF